MKIKNNDFFKNIDSEIKAYLLGFYLGDGSISLPNEKRIRYDLRISVSEKDIYILKLFQEYISPESSIRLTSKAKISKIREQYFYSNNQFGISINSKELCLTLDSYGYGQNKTYKEKHIPSIEDKFMNSFLRGYFDADGVCITGSYNRNDRKSNVKRVKTTFCITSKDKFILEDIQKYLLENLDIDIKLYREKSKDVYNLKSACNPYLVKLYNYLYTGAEFYLERKKKSFAEVMLTPREFRELKSFEPRNA